MAMYLYSREITLSNPLAALTAKEIAEHLSATRNSEVALYAVAYSPGWGRVTFSSWWEDMASLDAAMLEANEDAKYLELSLALAPSVVAVNDVLLDVVFTTQEATEMEMPNIVWSVGGTAVSSRAVEAAMSGIELCQAWKQATGTDATFGRAVTGPFGAIGWLSGFENMGEFDAAWTASGADENWIATLTGSQENFGQDFGSGTSTLYRKM